MKTVLSAVFICLFSSCSYYYARYNPEGKSVDTFNPYRSVSFSSSNTYHDTTFSIVFSFENDLSINFKLTPKKYPVSIIWDECSISDQKGQTSKVIHSGVRLITKADHQPPTMVPPGSTVTESITPINNISFYGNDWEIDTLYPPCFSGKIDTTTACAQAYSKVPLKSTLTFDINGKKFVYTFTFKPNFTIFKYNDNSMESTLVR